MPTLSHDVETIEGRKGLRDRAREAPLTRLYMLPYVSRHDYHSRAWAKGILIDMLAKADDAPSRLKVQVTALRHQSP